MSNEEASATLKDMGVMVMDATDLASNVRAEYFCASGGMATLDGDFTAAQLEAIAAWMRDPAGVASA